MKRLLLVLLLPLAMGAGFAFNDSFVAYTPPVGTREEQRAFAAMVVAEADRFRGDFIDWWLDGEPPGDMKSCIYVTFEDDEDSGRTWAIDYPGREYHNVYLHTTPERAVGSTLRHEVVHTILATKFPHPNRLPSWIEEGIATRYDDRERKAARRATIRSWLAKSRIPRLRRIFTGDLHSSDDDGYAAACYLVDFLLTLDDRSAVIRCGDFARSSPKRAFREVYGIESIAELQRRWGRWLQTRLP
jgi:hypothetical protein